MKSEFVIRNPILVLSHKVRAFFEDMAAQRAICQKARQDMRLVKYAKRHMNDDDFSAEDAYDAIGAATCAIDHYEEAVMLNRCNEQYGSNTIRGRIALVAALAVVEVVMVMLLLCIVSAIFGVSAISEPDIYLVGPAILLAVAIPMDILAGNGKLLEPLVRWRIFKLRAWRDELRETFPREQ